MLKYNMPFYLFTFRPQISEQELFENFITLFLPQVKSLSNYAYTIEEDNTLQKHIHVLAESNAKDNSAFQQIFNKKIFKDFKKSLKTKQTNEYGFDNRKVQEDPEDFLKVLGYVMKEAQALRRGTSFPLLKIDEAREYYFTCKHIEKQSKIDTDLKIMTPKNIHVCIKDYCLKNNREPTNFYTKTAMIKDGYMFDHKNAFQEIEINMFPERFPETKKMQDGQEKTYNNLTYENDRLEAENQKLLEQLNHLKSHFKVSQIITSFSGQVKIKGFGADEEYQVI